MFRVRHPHWRWNTHTRVVASVTALALFMAIGLIWLSPRPEIFGGGPSADAVAAQRNGARANDLKQQLVDAEGRPDKRANDLKSALTTAQTKLDAAYKKLGKANAESSVTDARVSALHKEIDTRSAALAKAYKSAGTNAGQIKALHTEITKREAALKTAYAAAGKSAASEVGLRNEIKKRETALSASYKKLGTLEKNQPLLKKAYADLGKANANLATAQASLVSLRTQRVKTNATVKSLYATVGSLTASLKTEQTRSSALKAEVDRLNILVSRPRPDVVPPAVALYTKAQILTQGKLFGLYTAQSPFSYAVADSIQDTVGRSANVIGYFQSWTTNFRPDAVEEAWRHGQIPLLTWEPQAQVGSVGPNQPAFTMSKIYGGEYDAYITAYAQAIKSLGLPLILRFAHEMNSTGYPWSEIQGWDGKSINGNHKGDYVKMWRHVHDIFQAQGANDFVIWDWSPNRVNRIPSQPKPVNFYPGDDYVDYVGMSAYWRTTDLTTPPTFDSTFGQTMPLLREFKKPIFLSEVGATDLGGYKETWITDFFKALALPVNADVVGFGWFALTITSNQGTSDWSLVSTSKTAAASRKGLADSGYGIARKVVSNDTPVNGLG